MRRLAACLVLTLSCQTGLSAAPVLEKVVILSRHGVRAPLRSVDVFQTLTKRGWPKWPVGPGEMTDHGAKNLAFMADFLRGTYVKEGTLPASGCPTPGAVQIWADVADHRTRQSGEIWAERLAPGCGVASAHAAAGVVDPLFDAAVTNTCPVGFFAAGKALLAATREGTGLLRPEDRHALEVLQGIVAPEGCNPRGAGICLIPAPGATSVKAAAQLALGSMIAEGIYLQYAQGFPPADVGWGKAADLATIKAIIPAHERGTDLRRRPSVLAARRGAVMAGAILAWLDGRTPPKGAPAVPPDAKLVMIAGHDSNLLYMASLMGLDWELPNQPSDTAPDTSLAFEVWREPSTNRRTVRVIVYAQTLEQLRAATPLDAAHPPDVVPVVPEACAKTPDDCPLDTFTADVRHGLESICGG
jgi:4-phytase/acid phosphatase